MRNSTENPPPTTTRNWSASEVERRALVEQGHSVLANKHRDRQLIAWAKSAGLYVPINRQESRLLGNKYRIDDSQGMTRDHVIELFRLVQLPLIVQRIDWSALQGKVLGCFCYPEPCHGNVILGHLASLVEGGGRS